MTAQQGYQRAESSAVDTVKATADKVTDAATATVDQAKDVASNLAHDAQTAIRDVAETQKQSAGQLIQSIARAAEAAAGELEKTSPEIAGHVRDAATGLDRYGRDFENQSVSELMQAFTGYARRDPTILLAGSVIAGFLATRFIKSTSDPAEANANPDKSSGETWQERGTGVPGSY